MARLWAVATRDLQFPIHGVKYDEVVMQFFALPLVAQEAAIMALMDEYRSIVTIARVWSAKAKLEGRQAYELSRGTIHSDYGGDRVVR